ncbi:MAG TPA: anhydro-N-acetylmuramic acid kinase [Candidatus Acidoferrum sp.]|jgi:anhydro-N-acetylmuramic acid kinase|nr:anhydro-N-acetylmuramic acid kinase [Candidatus Acidoferrum sp.]
MSARAKERGLLVLGLMSGTSADGIDVALARISGAPPRVKARLLNHTAVKFPVQVRAEILRVAEQRAITAGELSQLNFRLGQLFADAAKTACNRFRVAVSSVDLIGSHGQTIFHQGVPGPYLGGRVASTLQVGEAAVIAARTGVTTVADFRPADMAVGGQGAPLVPYADYLLYSDRKLRRVSLNLGGIANVTVIPAGAGREKVFAFDTGPANMLIDALVAHFSRGRQKFDDGARLALAGRAIPGLLDELMRDPYLKLKPPKSTGREYYGGDYVKRVLALGRRYRAKPNDLIRCVTIFTALSVVDALNRFVTRTTKIDQLIVSGGGARNPLIMAQLGAALPGIEVFSSSRLGVPEEGKEAFAFALLAYETVHQRAGNVFSATGASGPAVLGKICYAGG